MNYDKIAERYVQKLSHRESSSNNLQEARPMNQTIIDQLNDSLAAAESFTGHKYVLGLAQNPDPVVLGEHYFYIERRVNATTQPYVRDTFGEWMNFLEVSREPDINKLLPSRGTDPLGSRIGIEALLSLIYDRSVINDRGVLRGVLNILAGLGYVPFGVVIAGRDDHLEVGITLCGKNDAYRIDLTVNTQ